ncbi:DUF3515 domain-containing protein [Gordonia neofelifaecis]|uniref:DUF3515 domain-containing protein n=1 Tax=Gordonia neofelifaecis NRRL B-59395 TaxID=644548 RepID=F1YF07_9ACTN|nr:DUF3515 domain-containing protein [Gordonia neofelifaecis]EGD56990.1 hypothetical protein SCNU_01390 [Gordonia neofelifaecis NRRL B-59395]
MSDGTEKKSAELKPADEQTSETSSTTKAAAESGSRLSPALIATLVAIPVMVLAGFITYAALNFSSSDSESSPVESYATSAADSAKCAAFIDQLPEKLGDFGDKSVDGTTVRWTKPDSDPVVLRCGVERPDELAPTSALQVINPVQWFMTDTIDGRGQAFVSVDHRPYVAVWVPVGAGNAPITDVSALIEAHLERAPLDFGK